MSKTQRTWDYLEGIMSTKIKYRRSKYSVILEYSGREVFIPAYPRIESPRYIFDERTVPTDLPKEIDIVQWKANGSNVRVFAVGNILLAFVRGGQILDFKQYIALTREDFAKRLIELSRDENVVIFGELVGPDSLVRLCINEWRSILGGDIGYLIFDVYRLEEKRFLSMDEVVEVAGKYKLRMVPTEWDIDIDKLYARIASFHRLCRGELWEGFVLKNRERGSYSIVRRLTLKWRLEHMKEFAPKGKDLKTKRRILDLAEVIRKYVMEGYLDPPRTKVEETERSIRLRQRAKVLVEKGGNALEKQERIAISKELNEILDELLDEIISDEIKERDDYGKIKKFGIKKFIKSVVW